MIRKSRKNNTGIHCLFVAGLATTISIETDTTATEGSAFKLGAWSIGSTETEEPDDIMQVVLKFTRP